METKTPTNGETNFADFKKQFENIELSGYIWMVEKKEPFFYHNEIIIFYDLYKTDIPNKTPNPFNKVQEAYLTDNKYSAIHIKNIDGKELVFINQFSAFNNTELFKLKEVVFPSHINGVDSIHFKQVFELTPSPISGDDFKTWQPIVKLFVELKPKKN